MLNDDNKLLSKVQTEKASREKKDPTAVEERDGIAGPIP